MDEQQDKGKGGWEKGCDEGMSEDEGKKGGGEIDL